MSRSRKLTFALFVLGCLLTLILGKCTPSNNIQTQIGIVILATLTLIFYVNRFKVYSAVGYVLNYFIEKYWFVFWPLLLTFAGLIIYGIVTALI